MLPQFPKFEQLKINHYKTIQRITNKYLPYSDFNFTCLWSYNIFEAIKISTLNNNLVIYSTDYKTHKSFITFFGENHFIDTCKTLLEYCKQKKINPKLKLVPEIFVLKNFNNQEVVEFSEDRDNFDYVLLLKNNIRLNGSSYGSKRRAFNRFCRNNPNHKVKFLDIKDDTTKKDINKLFNIWAKNKNKNKDEILIEHKALTKLIKEAHFIKFIITGIYLNKELIAFSVNEKHGKDYAIAHFGKTNPTFSGITEALYKYASSHLIKNGCKYWNIECDMGDEKLRQAKLLWRPKLFLKKYDVTFK